VPSAVQQAPTKISPEGYAPPVDSGRVAVPCPESERARDGTCRDVNEGRRESYKIQGKTGDGGNKKSSGWSIQRLLKEKIIRLRGGPIGLVAGGPGAGREAAGNTERKLRAEQAKRRRRGATWQARKKRREYLLLCTVFLLEEILVSPLLPLGGRVSHPAIFYVCIPRRSRLRRRARSRRDSLREQGGRVSGGRSRAPRREAQESGRGFRSWAFCMVGESSSQRFPFLLVIDNPD
jgi:hypothetical protein